MEVDLLPQLYRRRRGTVYERACRVLKEPDAETLSAIAGVWHWDGVLTVRHCRTRFPAYLQPDTGIWVAGDDTPWATLIEAIEHLEWLARDLGV